MEKPREDSDDFRFPFQGLDLSTGLNAQRPGTTPIGQNVRSYDAGSLRMRGGSRAGLTPFLGAGSTVQVSNFNLIQHLNDIIWVSRAATFPPNNTFSQLDIRLNYSETDNPPARNAPQVDIPFQWFINTAPNFTGVSGVLSPADGGGTGKGTADFKLSTDGTTVTLVATFVSAGFPGPYFYSGAPQVQTVTQSNVNFFNPSLSQLASNWTVVAGSFIGNLFFNIFYNP